MISLAHPSVYRSVFDMSLDVYGDHSTYIVMNMTFATTMYPSPLSLP